MSLSEKIKGMKFMKRKDDAEERKRMEEKEKKLVEQGHWILNNDIAKPKFNVAYDGSLGNLASGSPQAARQSFKSFNPELDKLAGTINSPDSKVAKLDNESEVRREIPLKQNRLYARLNKNLQ